MDRQKLLQQSRNLRRKRIVNTNPHIANKVVHVEKPLPSNTYPNTVIMSSNNTRKQKFEQSIKYKQLNNPQNHTAKSGGCGCKRK